ncbi:VCBS repeat-containing protein [Alteromonas gracilis]|uniref:VCBS repeat-containing protein n=1 Tax=Alteromonas gracilis TaxID=1479524 RepID=UPI002FE2EE4A
MSQKHVFGVALLSFLFLSLPVNAQSFIDEDNDNMDDVWERTYGLLVGRDDSIEDPDGDGFTNIMEYAGDSHPTDISSAPQLSMANINFEDPSHLNLLEVTGATIELVPGAGTYGSTALRLIKDDNVSLSTLSIKLNLASRGVVVRAKSESEDDRPGVWIKYKGERVAGISVANQWTELTNFVPSTKFDVKEQQVTFEFSTPDTVLVDDIFYLTYGENNFTPPRPESVELVSVDENGNDLVGTFQNVLNAISPLGNWVAFTSDNNVYVRNLDTNTTKRIINETILDSSAFSYDGRYFAYSPFDSGQLFVYDSVLDNTVDYSNFLKDSSNVSGGINYNRFIEMHMSANGRIISLISRGNLDGVEGGSQEYKVFAFDTFTNRVTRDSTGSNGELGSANDSSSSLASLSANGRYHYFRSRATGFTDEPLSDGFNLFLKDRKNGELRVVNKDMKFNITPVEGAAIGTLSFDGKSASFIGVRDPYAPDEPWYTWRNNPGFAMYRDFESQETKLYAALKEIEGFQGTPGSFFINDGVLQSIDNRLAFSVISRPYPLTSLVFTGNDRRSSPFTITDLFTGESKPATVNKDGMHFDLNDRYRISADGRYAFFQTRDPRALPGYFTEPPDGGRFVVRVDFGEQGLIIDTDMDGVPDFVDDFPYDENETIDADWDGLGDIVDTDDDNDSIPDEYEDANGLNRYDALDAEEDDDADGFTNFEEFNAGSDPQNAASTPDNPTTPSSDRAAYDYDGDGISDLVIRRPDIGQFLVARSSDNKIMRAYFGANSSDIPLAGDFDGDGMTDIAIRRPSAKQFITKGSSDNQIDRLYFGSQEEDIPVIADYDGDGITDIAIRRPSTGQWFIKYSSTGSIERETFGTDASDIPAIADYDGDGKADIAVRRQSAGQFIIKYSSTGSIARVFFGSQMDDIAVPADYDGDGKADIAIRRPSNGYWFIKRSSDNVIERLYFGSRADDIPVVADYDGDGISDIAIRRPSTGSWIVRLSSNNSYARYYFGSASSDIPLAAPLTQVLNMTPISSSSTGIDTNEDETFGGFEQDTELKLIKERVHSQPEWEVEILQKID